MSTALLGFMGLRLASSLLGGRGAAWGLELYGGLLVFAGWVGANKWSGRGMSRRCLQGVLYACVCVWGRGGGGLPDAWGKGCSLPGCMQVMQA